MDSRHFKFRAYYKPDFATKDGPLKFEQQEIDGELCFVGEGDDDFRYSFYVPFVDKNWIVQQYTGLNDKNGVPIFEGDLVNFDFLSGAERKFKKENQEVFFEDGAFYFGRETLFTIKEWRFLKESLEVIGDVFKNPELLK